MRTLKTTSPLYLKLSYSCGAFAASSQYGYGVVQKLYKAFGSPSCVEAETLSAKAPEATYACQRCTMAVRFARAASEGAADRKNVGERSEVKRELKSGGVTSETNHGIDFGLAVRYQICEHKSREKCYGLENGFRDVGRVSDEKVRENKIREELKINSEYFHQ